MDDKSNTKKRILWAAGEIFSETGFRQATIRQISGKAGVNIASINYYFQSKDNLYLETLRYWKDIAFEKYPRELGTTSADPPEKRLESFIRSFVFRILDSGIESRFGRLMAREFVEPTRALDKIIDEAARPMFNLVATIVGHITGRDPSSETVLFCCSSIIGQCLYFLYARPVFRKIMSPEKLRAMEPNEISRHIYQFTLAALLFIKDNKEGASP
ncbi:MAG: CerR family C-terminal domain-containing protein [Syntrophorhabdaceae bacterium]